MVGQSIGRYRMLRKLGEGGMAVVYEAVHEEIGRRAAIKMLHVELSRNADTVGRFFNEARAVNIIHHAGIVGIFEFGKLDSGTAYIVMEYLEGETLGQRMKRLGARSEAAIALPLIRQIASALSAAHDKGIIHRDLKPDNVMIIPDPEVPGGERTKILDFGIAKLGEEYHRQGDRKVKTRTGAPIGTPVYMAPEQCLGTVPVDARADVYSLGVLLYELLAGCPPFDAESAVELMSMHIHRPPPPLRQHAPEISPELAALVHVMLAKDPAERPSMADAVAALEGLGQAAPVVSRLPGRRLALAGAVLVLLGLGGLGLGLGRKGAGARQPIGLAPAPAAVAPPRAPPVPPPLAPPKVPAGPARLAASQPGPSGRNSPARALLARPAHVVAKPAAAPPSAQSAPPPGPATDRTSHAPEAKKVPVFDD